MKIFKFKDESFIRHKNTATSWYTLAVLCDVVLIALVALYFYA